LSILLIVLSIHNKLKLLAMELLKWSTSYPSSY